MPLVYKVTCIFGHHNSFLNAGNGYHSPRVHPYAVESRGKPFMAACIHVCVCVCVHCARGALLGVRL